MTCETVKDSIKSRGNLYVHNVDCDGKSLLVFAVKNHKRGEELMDDMKRYAKHIIVSLEYVHLKGGKRLIERVIFDCDGDQHKLNIESIQLH